MLHAWPGGCDFGRYFLEAWELELFPRVVVYLRDTRWPVSYLVIVRNCMCDFRLDLFFGARFHHSYGEVHDYRLNMIDVVTHFFAKCLIKRQARVRSEASIWPRRIIPVAKDNKATNERHLKTTSGTWVSARVEILRILAETPVACSRLVV